MGFAELNGSGESGSQNRNLDLVPFECDLLDRLNDPDIIRTKYKSEDIGLAYDKKEKKSDIYTYDGSETIVICPEPVEFIKEFDDVSDNSVIADRLFQEKLGTFQRIRLDSVPELKGTDSVGKRMWINKTLTGINLRPGNLNNDRSNFKPVRMCDDNVHGLIAGRTGSGKSVFINALILSLITEYAPWELNLFLADFKKVELSRYMNNADDANGNTPFTPHVNACAATSEIRYVISLLRYLVECMNARQEFFSRIGVTKIQEFRTRYGVVLPRVLLIVDEFQQLFMEATNRETEEIQNLLNSITKLGRATGFHLVFASQEMSGTLRGNTLANFKIRMCLPCNQEISTDILGNGKAADLERGYVLINTESGDELQNEKYRVPFIETEDSDDDDEDKTPFYKFLDEIKLAAKKFDLAYKTSTQKFYREEMQETEKAYRSDLDRIRDQKNVLVAKNGALFDAIVLGKTVMYSSKPNDKVSFYIERGRNKGVMIACPAPDDAARVRKLITENLIRSDQETYHFGMELNSLIFERYRIDKVIGRSDIHKYYPCDADSGVETLELMYYLRLYSTKYMDKHSDEMPSIKNDEDSLIAIYSDESLVREHNERRRKEKTLSDRLHDVEEKISDLTKKDKEKMVSPIIRFLEKCSSDIVLIKADNTKADLIELTSYKDIVSGFSANPDIPTAAEKGLATLETKIKALEEKACGSDKEKLQNQLAIARNKIFRRSIEFFVDKYEDKIPEQTNLSPKLEEIYTSVQPLVETYKKSYQRMMAASDELSRCSEEERQIQAQLEEIESTSDELEITEECMKTHITDFLSSIFDSAYTTIGYKKDKPSVPDICCSFEAGIPKWSVDGDGIDHKIKVIASDAIDTFVDNYRDTSDTRDFKKVVFWINGLDEIEKIPNRLVEVIRDAINQNILIICIITSELRDTIIRKAFDYAFVTGNIEKFYNMFNIRYTRQPLDSFVVNFGIRSKGLDIPFKMYKSNLDEIQSPNFIDGLLNA